MKVRKKKPAPAVSKATADDRASQIETRAAAAPASGTGRPGMHVSAATLKAFGSTMTSDTRASVAGFLNVISPRGPGI